MDKRIMKCFIMLGALAAAALFQTFALKADIGVTACWDSVGMNISQITEMKVGTFTMIMGVVIVLLQFIVLKKDFSPFRFLQLPGTIFYGSIMNYLYYNVFTFEISSYGVRVLLCVMSVVGMAVFLGITTCLNLVPTPTEAACYAITEKYHLNFGKLRLTVDITCIVISVLLSLVFGLSMKVREGTVVGMVILGPLMGACIKREKKLIDKLDLRENDMKESVNALD